jgi:hypothetical protein
MACCLSTFNLREKALWVTLPFRPEVAASRDIFTAASRTLLSLLGAWYLFVLFRITGRGKLV